MTRDLAERRAVRKYLSTGEQPGDGYVLATMTYPQRWYVIAKDSDGYVAWGFHVNPAGRLYRCDGHYLIALENEMAKAKAKVDK
jgi:hypothetical protein